MLQIRQLHERDTVACALAAKTLFQPIVSTTSLKAHGFEALTRLPADCQFRDVHHLLDTAHEDGCLRETERALLCNSLERFALFENADEARIFCNIDNRLFNDPNLAPTIIVDFIRSLGLRPANLCLETSERTPPDSPAAFSRLINFFLNHNIRIAIDDFGRGVSGLETLMLINPHYIKIDRLYVDGVAQHPRQQAIVANIIGLGHSLGLLTIAEGVETEADFRLLRQLGCDFVQGHLIATPGRMEDLRSDYSTSSRYEVTVPSVPPRIAQVLVPTEPLSITDSISTAVARFKRGTDLDFLPVTDESGFLHGGVYEQDLRFYMYGEYGPSLLANPGIDNRVERLVRRCPTCEATNSAETIVESYLVAPCAKGIALTTENKYIGLVSNQEILKLASERALEDARERNPLTLLPGNKAISKHISQILNVEHQNSIVFFDFDNFKCFNDVYGFGEGDRIIAEFADLLLRLRHSHKAFIGHIGGDDFFASVPTGAASTTEMVEKILADFKRLAKAHYSFEHVARNGIWSVDRFGQRRFFPLLRASAVVLELPASRSHITEGPIIAALAQGKAAAKSSAAGIHIVDFVLTATAESTRDLSTSLRVPAATG